jgi:phosphoribosylformimino-5-aminoimidazole carboxamide ribotide isomerase
VNDAGREGAAVAQDTLRVVGVLDLRGGEVVRGVGGRRHEYRPVAGRLTPSSRPLDVGRAFRDHFGLSELYVADLDALAGAEPAWEVYDTLRGDGFRLWVDAGVRDAAGARQLAAREVETVVVGLETVAGPAALAEAADHLGPRLVFSLDLKEGLPLRGEGDGWSIAAEAVRLGVRRVLVLDLARVGAGEGPGAAELCAKLAAAHPEVEVSAGGGVRGRQDLQRLRQCGVRAVLVASALHDGALRREDWEGL